MTGPLPAVRPRPAGPRILDFGEWPVYKGPGPPWKGKIMRLFGLLALVVSLAGPVSAQNRAGVFDHYLLALTWMPGFCMAEGDARDDPRCAAGRRAGWMVHGLWPQHANGSWPEFCQTPQRAPSRAETAAQAALFGTSGAAWHQWNKHGTCTGLSAADYYRLTSQALARVTLPDLFTRIDQRLTVAPQVIEAAFLEVNPSLSPQAMLTTCRGSAVYEVRICLTPDLQPRDCAPQTHLRECTLDRAVLHPLR